MTNSTSITYQEHFIPVTKTDELHLMRIYQPEKIGLPIFMLHGTIEDGRIFYSGSNKGLAPFLAEHGYDVYVADLRGHGKSKPAVNAESTYGQTETITEDIPAFINYILQLRGEVPQFWIAHSWGGVLLSAYFARNSEYRHLVKAMVYFAVKRVIRVRNWQRYFIIDFIWRFCARGLVYFYNYLPAKKFRLGSDDESKGSYYQGLHWVAPKPWVDPIDKFDYGAAIKSADLPPILYLVGENDHCLGHPNDVKDFMRESGSDKAKYLLLSKKNGNFHDYDHVNILTSPDARQDQFLTVLEFLEKN